MSATATPGEQRLSIDIDGRRREYLLHVPVGYDGIRALPVVFSFHGGGGSARLAVISTRWSEKADQFGFLVVYPEGVRPHTDRKPSFLRNPQFWNVGAGIGQAEAENVDDLGFVRALLDEIAERIPIDPRRIYACGFSNGASMAFEMAMHYSAHVAAVGAVSGHLWREEPAPRHAVSMIYMTGTDDPLNPLDGGRIQSPWGHTRDRPPISRSVLRWVEWAGCAPEPRSVSEQDGVRWVHYGPGLEGAEVDYATIVGAGHVWPGGPAVLAEHIAGKPTGKLDATNVIWDFFQRHPKS